MRQSRLSILLCLTLSYALSLNCLAQEKPNVIYILADDLGIGDLSCYGQTKFQTPHIDSLATEGMLFTNHYSGNTVCTPSRAVLMTGMHSGRCYVRGNLGDETSAALPEEMTVLPEVFKNAGYSTGAFGKWGLGVTSGSRLEQPSAHGFDTFCGWKSQLIAHTYYPPTYVKDGKEIPLQKDEYVNPIIMQAARDFIEASVKEETPFFAYIPTAIPHAAMHAPKELHDKWRKKFPEHDHKIGEYTANKYNKPKTIYCPDVQNPIAGFAAMMEHLDDEVGLILEQLNQLGIDDNTLIIFASDNGAHLEGGHEPEFWNSTAGLRGHKRDMHEGGIKSPMLARWPAHIQAGTISHHLSGFHDILPTLAKAIGQPVPEQNTGLSMLPTLTGKESQPQHDYLYFEFHQGIVKNLPDGSKKRYFGIHSQALRFLDWKLFQRHDSTLELYNLKDDPTESKDLANQPEFQPILEKAKSYIQEASQPTSRPIPPSPKKSN